MLSNVAVVCLSTLDWHFSWHPNHEIMYRFAEAGNRVLYVETTGMRNVRLGDWRRILTRARTAAGVGPRWQKTHPNLTIYAPLVLPFPHSRVAHRINSRIVFRRVDAWRKAGHEPYLMVWAYLPSPMSMALVDYLRPSVVVFHYMGDAKASGRSPGAAQAEVALLSRSDLVFANSLPLLERARKFTANAYLFRAGVDPEAFQRAALNAPRPAEFEGMRGPIAGYVGSIHDWLDLDLLAAVAGQLPSWHFVMVGTLLRDVSQLQRYANIHWLGPRPHLALPQYIKYFDVCMIPYVLDSYTASAYPGKLNEYLALGKPVVATALPELAAYNREFGDVVHLATNADAFRKWLVRAVEEYSGKNREHYLAVARANSWQTHLEAMSSLITAHIHA